LDPVLVNRNLLRTRPEEINFPGVSITMSFRTVAFRVKPTVIADLEAEVATRVTQAYVDTQLAGKADQTAVNAALAAKADQMTVTSALAAKADSIALVGLASESYVTTAVAPKADQAAVDAALAGKADATALNSINASISALDQCANVLVGPQGALQINQAPGSSTTYVYDGTVQNLQ
jgi:hypothetical protein